MSKDLFGQEEAGPQRLYLVCPSCRVMSFNLVAAVPEVGATSYEVHCAGCDTVVTASDDNPDFHWAAEVPPTPPAGTATELLGYTNTIATGNAELAKRRVMKHIERWAKEDTLILLCGYNTDDESSIWVNFEAEHQRQWVLRKLDELRQTVEGWNNG